MLFNALILALSCVCASASLKAASDDSDCALYLTGPGRSSAYDYSINLLKGNFGYDGQHTCITYEAINQAYLEARQRILVAQPKGDWKPEDYASVGELVLDISINIARRYGLTYEEIEKGLPLIDTSRTLIRDVCPPVFSHVECRAGKYRRLDGLCNNLRHPTWGATNAPFQRLLSPLFSDGINAPRISHTGRDLPLSRVVSRTMHPDDGFHDHAGTVMVIAWGQFMDHDYTLTGTPLDPKNRNDPEECCKRPPHLKHPYCNEIHIPDDDYFYRLFGVKCIDFVRGFPSPRPGCRLGSRTPFNTLTGAIDGNTVYGVTEKFARKLRTGFGGLLRMNPVFKEYGLKDLLPLKLDIPDEGCTRPNKNMYCFEAGEIRVNEQLVLTVMHTLMAREHNRVAHGLAEVNPHWDDETLYQEARRINIAEIQHITYNEFLPILLGKDVMEKFGLVLEKGGYWDGYDHDVNPDVLASFAAAAYRFGHSLLPTAVERWSKAHKFIASKRLSDLIRRPYDLYRAGVLDEYVMGLMNQVAQAMDDSITQEVTNHLFKKVGARFGMDLVSFNMQRGREFGLPGYMEFRKFCGLPGAETFQELFGSMTNQTVRKYESIFEHPIDVDLWSGGVSERPLPGSMLGPTFACIIATQFSYSRRGDRFWFELPNQPSSFTPEQLAEVRKARLSRVICDNTDIIDTVQLYPMVLPDHELNPRVPCRSGIIPSMDFSKWAEPAPFRNGNAKEFITDAIASRNVTKSNATNNIEQNINITQNGNQIFVLQNNVSCNCNETTVSNQNAQVQCTNNTTAAANDVDCYSKTVLNNDNEVINNKTENKSDNDTILKYVYKKNETHNIEKPKGHFKNSLRRKRSLTDSQHAQNAPLIVNYETSHIPRDREEWLPAKNTANVIKSSDLADFNIETLHESVGDQKLQNNDRSHSDNNGRKQEHKDRNENKRDSIDSNEEIIESKSQERDDSIESKSNTDANKRDSIYSNEEINESKSQERDDSIERNLNTNENSRENVKQNTHSNESEQNDDRSTENRGRKINDDEQKSNNLKFSKPRSEGSSENSEEVDENTRRTENRERKRNDDDEDKYNNLKFTKSQGDSSENSQEVDENINSRGKYNISPHKIQSVDLDDFSYERIQLNKNGEVEPAKDDHGNEDVEIISPSKPRPFTKTQDETNAEPYKRSDSNSNEENEPTHIDDGEVKPVVEINPESDSIESNEENIGSSNENESLESLTGVKEDSNEKYDKLQEEKGSQDVGDVKQQFERVPLNYNHGKQKQAKTEDFNQNKHSDNRDDEVSVDKLTPSNVHYDENLNIKFDDIAIKLPDIKLPEDILSYPYEYPPVYKNEEVKKKPVFFHYNSDESEEEKQEGPGHDEDNDHISEHQNTEDFKHHNDADSNDYYGNYGNTKQQAYRNQKNEDKEKDLYLDDDPYERFVRERFGKRDTFKKRSEKLRDLGNHNPELYKKVHSILEKTKNVKKEAAKSGDPNAGYMWALEYGEKL